MNTELLKITDETALEAFSKPDGVVSILNDAIKQAEELKKDANLSTDKGRKQIASNARKFATLKSRLDALGKGSTDEMRETIKSVNSNRNQVKVKLDELRDEVRKPLTDWENSDKKRKSKLETAVHLIIACGVSESDGMPYTLEILKANKAYLDSVEINESTFEEYELEARKMREKSHASVTQLIANEETRLAEEAELEQLRKEKIERESKERDEAIKREAKEKAEREAQEKQHQLEQEKQEALEREERAKIDTENAKREKVEAEERAKAQAKIAEENRIEALKKAEIDKYNAIEQAKKEAREKVEARKKQERLEQEKKEANTKHVGSIRKQAKESIMSTCGLDESTAKKVILAISNHKISNVIINY